MVSVQFGLPRGSWKLESSSRTQLVGSGFRNSQQVEGMPVCLQPGVSTWGQSWAPGCGALSYKLQNLSLQDKVQVTQEFTRAFTFSFPLAILQIQKLLHIFFPIQFHLGPLLLLNHRFLRSSPHLCTQFSQVLEWPAPNATTGFIISLQSRWAL